MRSVLLAFLLSPALAACLLDGNLKHDNPTVPESLADGWEIASPESAGVSPAALASVHHELLREDRHVGTLGFLVVKDGKLVWETYLRSPADRDHYHHVQSVTKSVTSLLLGIVRGDLGGPPLDARLGDLLPDEMAGLEPDKPEIRLRDLLTMRSGIAFDNDRFSMEMWVGRPSDPLRHILSKPLYARPGERFYYRDADPQIVGYLLRKLTGRPEHELAADRLFSPLGIQDFYWDTGADGVSMAAHGLHLRPRDLAKIAQLVLDGGRWRGQQVVPSDWLASSTMAQTDSAHQDRGGHLFPYGFYWWIVPDVGFTVWGHGGQFALVVPARRLLLVQIALPDADLHGSDLNDFLELVAPLL